MIPFNVVLYKEYFVVYHAIIAYWLLINLLLKNITSLIYDIVVSNDVDNPVGQVSSRERFRHHAYFGKNGVEQEFWSLEGCLMLWLDVIHIEVPERLNKACLIGVIHHHLLLGTPIYKLPFMRDTLQNLDSSSDELCTWRR